MSQNQISISVYIKQIYNNNSSHFDENVLRLHISVKDPTAVERKKKINLFEFYFTS